jgi:hypothetical protein
MEFRLIYKGRLPAESRKDTRAKDKQSIRKVFHKQLVELLKHDPIRRWQITDKVIVHPSRSLRPTATKTQIEQSNSPQAKPFIEYIADKHETGGYRFFPLLRKDYGVTCKRKCPELR